MTHPKITGLQWIEYFPGAIGKITELHAIYYYENWHLDVSFEAQVGKEISEFIAGFQKDKDGLWIVTSGEMLAGCIVIDSSRADTQGARLRWFIVAPEFQGLGIGRALLNRAVAFCGEAGYRRIYLWTFKGLDVARSLYESIGFQLSEEIEAHQWGIELVAQKFELSL
jgi:GNAT superfamily N-acetyltransferase